MQKNWLQNIIILIITLSAITGLFISFSFFTKNNLTANEQVLFSIILTVCSAVVSWVISHIYYQKSHEESIEEIQKESKSNLKVFGTKAAEKVKNLSSEINNLKNYLKEELDDDSYEFDRENLNAKREIIYSAIHILNTLKSINDGSLSDWKGIIPEEIEEMEEEQKERFENLNNILYNYKDVIESSDNEMGYITENELSGKIRELNKKIDLAINNAGISTKVRRNLVKKEQLEKRCPECQNIIQYKQRPLSTSRKNIKCSKCGVRLACRWNEQDGFTLAIYDESFHGFGRNDMDDIKDTKINEEFIEIVRKKLPPQPWLPKTSDKIADELGVSKRKTGKAITVLIERGIFKQQINGILYIPDSNQNIIKDKSDEVTA